MDLAELEFQDTRGIRAFRRKAERITIRLVRIINNKDGRYYFPDYCRIHDEDRIVALYPAQMERNMPAACDKTQIVKQKSHRHKHFYKSYFSFPSTFVPLPIFSKVYRTFSELHTVYGAHYRPQYNDSSDTAIVYCHGWSERNLDMAEMLTLNNIARHKLSAEVFVLQMPHHMKRKTRGAGFSGNLFLNGEPLLNLEACRQSVSDIVQFLVMIRKLYSKIIVVGLSMGAHLTSFLATHNDLADHCIIIQAGGDIPNYLPDLLIAPCMRRRFGTYGWSREKIAKLYEPMLLTRYQAKITGDRVVVIAGKYDEIIPFKSAQLLADFFDAEHRIYYPGGHFSVMTMLKCVEQQFLRLLL